MHAARGPAGRLESSCAFHWCTGHPPVQVSKGMRWEWVWGGSMGVERNGAGSEAGRQWKRLALEAIVHTGSYHPQSQPCWHRSEKTHCGPRLTQGKGNLNPLSLQSFLLCPPAGCNTSCTGGVGKDRIGPWDCVLTQVRKDSLKQWRWRSLLQTARREERASVKPF